MPKSVNLFIVGAMKAGTTSFVEILAKHPDIYVPPIKEPHFFIHELPKTIYTPSRFFSLNKYFENDFPKPLHITKIYDKKHYKKLYTLGLNKRFYVDASTCYLSAPESASLIKNYNPTAKIIIILRNPLDRAFSHFTMNTGLGRENRSFNKAIEEELLAFKNNQLSWSSYIGMSLYKEAINRYNTGFKDVLILRFEELYSKKAETLEKVSTFLKIEAFNVQNTIHKNKGRQLRFQKLFYYLKKMGLKDYFSKLVPQNTRQKLFKIASTQKQKTPKLTTEIKQQLKTVFKNHT